MLTKQGLLPQSLVLNLSCVLLFSRSVMAYTEIATLSKVVDGWPIWSKLTGFNAAPDGQNAIWLVVGNN